MFLNPTLGHKSTHVTPDGFLPHYAIAAGKPSLSERRRTHLAGLELWGLAVKHIDGFDAILQHADGPVEHSHEVALRIK